MDFLYETAFRLGIKSRPVETVQCGINLLCHAANNPYITAGVATVTAIGAAAGYYFMSNRTANNDAPVVDTAPVVENVANRTRSKSRA